MNIRIAVYTPGDLTLINPIDPWHELSRSKVTEHTRKYWVIQRQINKMHRKYQKCRELGKKPTHWMINELDYKFIKAYFEYTNRDNHYFLNYEQADRLFGLKIILHDGKTTLGWEP